MDLLNRITVSWEFIFSTSATLLELLFTGTYLMNVYSVFKMSVFCFAVTASYQ